MEREDKDLRDKLSETLKKRGYSQERAARSMGVSGGALSAWLTGKYSGDNEKMNQAVQSYLKLETERQQKRKKGIAFVKTAIAEEIFRVARICHTDLELGVVCGPSGIGKTCAVKEYASRNRDVILIEGDPGYTAKDVFAEIMKKLGEYPASINTMKNMTIARLKDSGRLIIIDEAENLPLRAIDLLRRVHDKAEIGVMFVGLNRLYEGLISRRTVFSYVLSRIGVVSRLNPLTVDDLKKIINKTLPNGEELAKTLYEISRGNARTASKLIFRSQVLADDNEMPITADIIRECGRELFI
ncbi:MAG TPA: AAA family ATPase [Alphaproteobacteria bacterium]|nr:AAA family ATPase [Alphaproteobacteria bacterium]